MSEEYRQLLAVIVTTAVVAYLAIKIAIWNDVRRQG